MPENELKNLTEEIVWAAVESADKVKAAKAAKPKKKNRSILPLRFEVSENDSPLKTAIIEQINKRDLKYSDMFEFCTLVKWGNAEEGQKLGYNLINGLKSRPSMLCTTVSLLCDFLDLDILLVDKSKNKKKVSKEEEKEETK